MEQEHKGDQLQEEVEWYKAEDDSTKLIDDLEHAIHNPIGEPLFIIFYFLRLKSNKGHEGWVKNTNRGSDVDLAHTEHDKADASVESIVHDLGFLEASGSFDLVENFVH